jgi:N-methylhydantoinase A/oxoprolinase/acetone carboxylase beta subunit
VKKRIGITVSDKINAGLEIDGREITSLNSQQIKDTVLSIQSAGIKTVAVVGVFSPLDHEGVHEETCKRLMLEQDPSLSVVCSHTIGGVGLLERENATILNASILKLAQRTVQAFCQAMVQLQLDCPLFLTQNDGTLTDAISAAALPIKTFASGPTNSMTGAAFLAALDRGKGPTNSETQILVIDVGGTTSDVCALLPSGFPRQAPNFVEVGGVRTAFSMPEVLSVGLGGGSRVVYDTESGRVRVGPESVGHYLTSNSMVFGGDVMTTTDIVVATGKADIGDTKRAHAIPEEVVTSARAEIKRILERAVEVMKVSDLPITLLLVGGGSIVQMDNLEGVAECIIPPHHDSANAVGAAIAKVAGEVDVIEILEGRDEKEVLEKAKNQAIEAAVTRGADREDVKIVAIDKIPLQYVTNKATRLVIKAVGKLALPDLSAEPSGYSSNFIMENGVNGHSDPEANREKERFAQKLSPETLQSAVKYSSFMDIESYKPDVRNGVWYISPVDLEFMATGTGVLGTGGGGPSYLQYLQCLESLRQPGAEGKMRVMSPGSMKDSDICVFGSWYGAPSVSGERIPAGTEIMTAVDHSVRISGHSHFEAVIADEIGGGNGLSTFPTSVYYDIPVIDGDLMGRAYPTLEHGKSNSAIIGPVAQN